MLESEFRIKEINHKRIVLLLSIVIASLAWFHNSNMRQKEFQKAYYEQRIETINMVYSIVNEINQAKTIEEKLRVSKKFWIIHYGYSISYLNGEMFKAMSPISEYINKCIQKHSIQSAINCKFSINMYLPEFSLSAREHLSKGWDINFEEISKTHPWHDQNKI